MTGFLIFYAAVFLFMLGLVAGLPGPPGKAGKSHFANVMAAVFMALFWPIVAAGVFVIWLIQKYDETEGRGKA